MTFLAFQADAFQWGFQSMDVIPTFIEFIVPKEHRIVKAGHDVLVVVKIADLYSTLGIRELFDPSSTPQIQVYFPDGTIAIAYTNMTFMDVGTYNYVYTTIASDPVGEYTAQFQATNGSVDSVSPLVKIFTMV